MNVDTLEKLRNAATLIDKFRNLESKEQEWLLELLSVGKTAVLALSLLDAIAQMPLTFKEIAIECECHPQTVSQVLNALSQGGLAIEMDKKSAYAPTGRPRKLAQKLLLEASFCPILRGIMGGMSL